MTTTASQDIDFEAAFAMFKRYKVETDAPTKAELLNDVATMLMPLTESMAKTKAVSYRNGRYAARMDYDECLSRAQEGIHKVLCAGRSDVVSASHFQNRLRAAIRNSLTDAERRTHRGIQTVSGDTNEERPWEPAAPGDGRPQIDNEIPFDAKRTVIDTLLHGCLSTEQYETIKALLNAPDDQSWEETAASIGVRLGTFKSRLSRARAVLRAHPDLEQEVNNILAETWDREPAGVGRG
jgi:DNA-directed RNA polymerase specialized sigma24 family protein